MELAKIIIVAALIVVPIRYFIFQPFIVKQQSMEPNFFEGDYLIVDEISYRFQDPQRGEVIVFNDRADASRKYIKRIIGLPGEKLSIREGRIYLLNAGEDPRVLDESGYLPAGTTTSGDLELSLGQEQYFVMGDNRSSSTDSRVWGPIKEEYIIGRVFLRLWPIKAVAKIESPEYLL